MKDTESFSVSQMYSPVLSKVVKGITSRRWAPSTSSNILGLSSTSRLSLYHRTGAFGWDTSQHNSNLSGATWLSSTSGSLGERILTGGSEHRRYILNKLSNLLDSNFLYINYGFTCNCYLEKDRVSICFTDVLSTIQH